MGGGRKKDVGTQFGEWGGEGRGKYGEKEGR